MIDPLLVELSRAQFTVTAMFHFLFVPLTLGLSWILVIMELVYVMTGIEIYRDMTRFWGKLFGINFALGVTSGLALEFEFGTNWAYYSHYVGDVFGAPLAIEGLMAFFLESTFIGLFFLGWERLSRRQHLMATFLAALGSNLSAVWILVANGWMQNPVGSTFSAQTMRMELTSFMEVFLNPVAQVKFVHTVAAGYVTASMFVLGISAYYMLKGRDLGFAKRSFAIATGFGLASVLAVMVLGDESGYTIGDVQKTKLATIEAKYKTQTPPPTFTLFGIPDDKAMKTRYAVDIPAVFDLVAAFWPPQTIVGIEELMGRHERRIRSGMIAYADLLRIRAGDASEKTKAEFEVHKADLGYGLLLKRYTNNVTDATDAQIKSAVRDSIPSVPPLFFSYRIMLGSGFLMLFLIAAAFYFTAARTIQKQRWLLRTLLWSIPIPWISCQLGWFVAEYGRQPWAIGEVLPTFLATSSLTVGDLVFSLTGFLAFYTFLLIIGIYLTVKFARLGPASLGTGRYFGEQGAPKPASPAGPEASLTPAS